MTLSLFTQLSDSLADEVAAVSPRVAAIGLRDGRHLTATVWKDDLIVASEQALPRREAFPVRLQASETEATVVGRDDASNIALLRLSGSAGLDAPAAAILRTGGLALALGARADATPTACLGVVNSVGPAWRSQRGGKIDAYIKLDLGMAAYEEGGPAVDGRGGIAGMTTFGPRGQVLVIPHATIERAVPVLLSGAPARRGWLGVALQPVAVPDIGDIPAGRGFMIMSIVNGGPADAAGLTPGDIVVAVDGKPAGRLESLVAELDADSIGRALALSVVRVLKGGIETVSLTIGEHPGT